jgi:uncharacterized membrane protein
MWQFLGILLLIGVFIVAVKVALALLLLAGLIFRTKETIGLIGILAAIAGFNAHPAIGVIIIIVLIAASMHLKKKEEAANPAAITDEQE